MKVFKLIYRLLLPPAFAILYLFAVMLFCYGNFMFVSLYGKVMVLSTVVICNIIPLIFIERYFKFKKVLYYLFVAISVILSTFLISEYIYFEFTSIIYIAVLWIISARTILRDIDTQTISYSALAVFLYYITNVNLVYATIPFAISMLVVGAIGTYKIYKKEISLLKFLSSCLVGVGCAVLSVVLF